MRKVDGIIDFRKALKDGETQINVTSGNLMEALIISSKFSDRVILVENEINPVYGIALTTEEVIVIAIASAFVLSITALFLSYDVNLKVNPKTGNVEIDYKKK